MDEMTLLKNRITELEGILSEFVYSDRYISQKHMQFLDGKNIQFARSTGTKIGTAADQKLAFHGVTPTVQGGSINAPSAPGVAYNQAEAASAVAAINSIRTILINKGLTA